MIGVEVARRAFAAAAHRHPGPVLRTHRAVILPVVIRHYPSFPLAPGALHKTGLQAVSLFTLQRSFS